MSVPVIDVTRGDITRVGAGIGGAADAAASAGRPAAIVNAANSSLLGGGGVDGAIHRAGGPDILAECTRLRATSLPDGLQAGKAVATTAGRLPVRWVVHTVGPVHSRREDRSHLLRSCYTASLAEAGRVGAVAVAFPLISAGAYGWPAADAIAQAVAALRTADSPIEAVTLVAFDAATAQAMPDALA